MGFIKLSWTSSLQSIISFSIFPQQSEHFTSFVLESLNTRKAFLVCLEYSSKIVPPEFFDSHFRT